VNAETCIRDCFERTRTVGDSAIRLGRGEQGGNTIIVQFGNTPRAVEDIPEVGYEGVRGAPVGMVRVYVKLAQVDCARISDGVWDEEMESDTQFKSQGGEVYEEVGQCVGGGGPGVAVWCHVCCEGIFVHYDSALAPYFPYTRWVGRTKSRVNKFYGR